MPDTTRCGCGGYGGHNRLGRYHSSDVKWLSTARHPEGLRRHSPTPMLRYGGCGSVVVVGDGLVAWRGCRRLCRGGGGGTRLVEMEKRQGRGLKQREAWHRHGYATAMTRWGDEDSGGEDDGWQQAQLAGKFFRRPENAMEAPDF
ncbi:hypothetical protein Tco_0885158 [Tanacetum coccineum]